MYVKCHGGKFNFRAVLVTQQTLKSRRVLHNFYDKNHYFSVHECFIRRSLLALCMMENLYRKIMYYKLKPKDWWEIHKSIRSRFESDLEVVDEGYSIDNLHNFLSRIFYGHLNLLGWWASFFFVDAFLLQASLKVYGMPLKVSLLIS